MVERAQTSEQKRRPLSSEAWGDIGSTLARIGVPIEVGPAEAYDPFEPELPLVGGAGAAPEDVEARRHVAAVIRKLYDDVFDYAVDVPVSVPEAPAEPHPELLEETQAPAPVEVQGIDRKTGKPVKLRVNMPPNVKVLPPGQTVKKKS